MLPKCTQQDFAKGARKELAMTIGQQTKKQDRYKLPELSGSPKASSKLIHQRQLNGGGSLNQIYSPCSGFKRMKTQFSLPELH